MPYSLPGWAVEWLACSDCDVMWLRAASLSCWFCGCTGASSHAPVLRGAGHYVAPGVDEPIDGFGCAA